MINNAFDEHNDIFASYSGSADSNYVDLGFANIEGIAPSDFDLVNAASPAVDKGAVIAENSLDYFNRTRPIGSAPDIGAMEFGSYQAECIPRFVPQSPRTRAEIVRPIVRRPGRGRR